MLVGKNGSPLSRNMSRALRGSRWKGLGLNCGYLWPLLLSLSSFYTVSSFSYAPIPTLLLLAPNKLSKSPSLKKCHTRSSAISASSSLPLRVTLSKQFLSAGPQHQLMNSNPPQRNTDLTTFTVSPYIASMWSQKLAHVSKGILRIQALEQKITRLEK